MRHGLTVLPRTKQKLQIIQNKCRKIIKNRHWQYSTFDLHHQETNVPMIEAFGEKIYEKFMQRCRFSQAKFAAKNTINLRNNWTTDE
jgi:hypothetical protein